MKKLGYRYSQSSVLTNTGLKKNMMFDQILNRIKNQQDGNPQMAAAAPPEKVFAVKT